jgi:hypothetical protein
MCVTENGAVSLGTTQDARLNLFFKTVRDMGVMDEWDNEQNKKLYTMIDESWDVNPLDTLKILMNWRDCRGGKGDHRGFVVAMRYVAIHYKEWFDENIEVIPTYGCFLDLVKLWHIIPSESKRLVMNFLRRCLENDIHTLKRVSDGSVSLVAKWLPSENSKWDRYPGDKREIGHGRFTHALCRNLFNIGDEERVKSSDIKKLRCEYLVPLRAHIDIVETKLCQKMYDDIEYEKVPSVALLKYKKTFKRHDADRFLQYLSDVTNGEKKINASQVYPHDLVRHYLHTHTPLDPVVEEQWKEIKKKVLASKAFDRSIVVCDVSGSMSGTPMEVAIALGLLGMFNNKIITFSKEPQLFHVNDGPLYQQVRAVRDMDWGYNTDFERVMDLVLGMNASLNNEQSIKRIFVFSDMQFDQAMTNADKTHFEKIKIKFKAAGTEIPQIIFWNLRGDTSDFPVSYDEKGVVLMSGYSPSLLKGLLDGVEITPLQCMLNIIHNERYDIVKAPITFSS